MKKRQLFAVVFCLFIASVPGWCEPAQISREQVLAALKAGFIGTPLEALAFSLDQINLPATVFARGHADVRLTQFSVDKKALAVDASLKCDRSACMPFYVTLTDLRFPADIKEKLTFRNSRTGWLVGASKVNAEPAVRQGDVASLSLQKNGMRISVPVVCLEQGAPGRVIRTRIVGTRRIAAAEVVGPGRLTGIAAGEQRQ